MRADEQGALAGLPEPLEQARIVDLDAGRRQPAGPRRSLVDDAMAEIQEVAERASNGPRRLAELVHALADACEVILRRSPCSSRRQIEIRRDGI